MNIKRLTIKYLLAYDDVSALDISRTYGCAYSSVMEWLNQLEDLGYCNKELKGKKFIFYKTQKLINFKPFMDILERVK